MISFLPVVSYPEGQWGTPTNDLPFFKFKGRPRCSWCIEGESVTVQFATRMYLDHPAGLPRGVCEEHYQEVYKHELFAAACTLAATIEELHFENNDVLEALTKLLKP
jgi:hypothetical protein